MTVEEIKKKFSISACKGTPLYKRLREAVETFIAECPDGFALPSEREIAEATGMNRRTISKALQPFVEEGLLERSVKGSTVRKKADTPAFEAIHPFVFEMTKAFNVKNVIRFTLFENYPTQKHFWTKVTESFNAGYANAKIELDWLPVTVNRLDAYDDYIRTVTPDIFQCVGHLGADAQNADETPRDIIETFSDSKNYWAKSIFSNRGEILNNFIPIMFAARMLVWNTKLAKRLKLDVDELLERGGIQAAFAAAASKLPAKIKVAQHIADFTLETGDPVKQTEEAIKTFFSSKFQQVASMPSVATNWFSLPIDTAAYQVHESMINFAKGKTLFCGGLSIDLPNIPEIEQTAYCSFFPDVGHQATIPVGVSGLQVNAKSPRKAAAWDFVRFMLSETVQNLATRMTRGIPISKKSTHVLMNTFHGTERALDQALVRCRIVSRFTMSIGNKLADSRRDFYLPLLRKEISPEEALKKTMEKLKMEEFI